MTAPILANKNSASPSVFKPEALLREARRQKQLAAVSVPPICILDPDGDIVRGIRQSGRSRRFTEWPCYHSEMEVFSLAALYTFAQARGAKVLCLAHVTNAMGQAEQDFEKGEADGTAEALAVLDSVPACFVSA